MMRWAQLFDAISPRTLPFKRVYQSEGLLPLRRRRPSRPHRALTSPRRPSDPLQPPGRPLPEQTSHESGYAFQLV